MQRLVGARQLVQDCLQDSPGVGGSDEFSAIVDQADHEAAALILLRLDNGLQGRAELGK